MPVEFEFGSLLTVPEVADKCRVSSRTVWREIRHERLRIVRVGKRIFVPEAFLRAYLLAPEKGI